MLLFAPLYAPLLLALIPKRMRGLRIALSVAGIACNILLAGAAFYYGITFQKNKRHKGSLTFRTSRDIGEPAQPAEGAWDRDSGAL